MESTTPWGSKRAEPNPKQYFEARSPWKVWNGIAFQHKQSGQKWSEIWRQETRIPKLNAHQEPLHVLRELRGPRGLPPPVPLGFDRYSPSTSSFQNPITLWHQDDNDHGHDENQNSFLSRAPHAHLLLWRANLPRCRFWEIPPKPQKTKQRENRNSQRFNIAIQRRSRFPNQRRQHQQNLLDVSLRKPSAWLGERRRLLPAAICSHWQPCWWSNRRDSSSLRKTISYIEVQECYSCDRGSRQMKFELI